MERRLPRHRGGARFTPLQTGAILLSLALTTAAYSVRVGDPILIETDLQGGVSDAFAIAHAVRANRIDVVAIVTPSSEAEGNAKVVEKLLGLIGRPDIPVGVLPVSTQVRSPLVAWGEDWEISATAPESATELILAQSEKHKENLQLLGLGTLQIVEIAFESAPSLPDRLRRVVVSEGGTETPAPLEAATSVLEADIPILLFGTEVTEISALTREDMVRIGLARTPLNDELTQLAARSRHPELDRGEGFPIPHCLSISHLNGIAATEIAPRSLSLSPNGDLIESGTGGRKVHVANSWRAQKPCENAIRTLTDARVDFGFHFSRFLMSLGALEEETRKELKEDVNEPGSDANLPPDLSEEEKSRYRLLGFLEDKIAALSRFDSKEVEKPLSSLEEAYLRYSDIGWWFPDELYADWTIEASSESSIDLRFGVANGTRREISKVEAVVEAGEVRISQTVDSATEDVVFHFDSLGIPQNSPFPEKIDLGLRFNCSGVAFSASRTVDLRIDTSSATR